MSFPIVSLGEIAEVIAGQSPESKYYNKVGEGIPFFQGKADFTDLFPQIRYYCTKPTKIAKPLDILLSVRAPVGPTNICDTEACIGRGLASIRVGNKIHYKYLFFFLKAIEKRLSEMGNGSTFSAITTGDVKSIQIPLPPLPIQKRIADILDKADALRKKDRELLKKYDELAQAIFIDMFGDPVKNEKGWEVKKLGECTSKIGSGSTPTGGKSAYKNEGISLIRSMNVYDFYIKWKDLAFIDNKQAQKLQNVEVKKGDVLFNITGASVGRCSIVPEEILPARVNQHVAILRAIPKVIDPLFLNYLLVSNSVKNKLLEVGNGGGAVMEAITKEQLENFLVVVPPIELQIKFSQKINQVKMQRNKAETIFIKSESLFQSLLQKAFKGELVK
jgi:type I restriction enzyme, S subunit